MYTRVYQGGKRPLPEDYHGTAFSKEEEMILPTPEEDVVTEENEEILFPFPPCKDCEEEEKEEASASPDECFESEEKGSPAAEERPCEDAWRGELLLVALCALLVECEEPDSRLLALLLLLLLSGNT
jgi:hypothetical protein